MTVITGGLIAYEDGVKAKEDYAPAKKARVELHFDCSADNAENEITEVSALAKRKVAELLGTASVKPVVVDQLEEKRDTKPFRVPNKKAHIEPPKVEAPKAEEDFLDAPVEETLPTDAELNALVQKKNAVLKDPVKIRALIATFNPDATKQFTLREIPHSERSRFVKELDALQ